jgi:hypothetical protein
MNALRRHPILAVLGALAAILIGIAGINAFDQELAPEARSFFTRPTVTFAPGSGWALLAGFHAPPGEDARAWGTALHKASLQRKPGTATRRSAAPLEVRAPDELICLPQDEDCVRKFAQRPESIRELVSDNAVLLERYEELLRSRGLTDVFEVFDYYEAIIPHFNTVLRTQQVRLSLAGVDAAAGRTAEAASWLEADAAFHRLWLVEAGSILTKMLAVRTLSRDFLVAGQIARSGQPLAPAAWDALERVVAPLAQEERGVAPVLRIEATLFANLLDQMLVDSRTTSRIIEANRLGSTIAAATLRRNATLNFAHPVFAAWTTLDAVPSHELARAIAEVEMRERLHVEPGWTWIYNATGKGLVREQKPQLAEYLFRVRDLDALAATIRCVIELRRKAVTREAAAAHVAASPRCIDPYEARPLGWDAARGELSFKARSPKQVIRFGGRGDRVAFAVYPPA